MIRRLIAILAALAVTGAILRTLMREVRALREPVPAVDLNPRCPDCDHAWALHCPPAGMGPDDGPGCTDGGMVDGRYALCRCVRWEHDDEPGGGW